MAAEIDPDELSFARPISGMNIASVEAAKDVLAGMLEHLRNLRVVLAAHAYHDETKAMIRKRIREHHANIRAHCDEHGVPLPKL
jgi:hypothetical protein